ncbi:MAG TPA: DUF3618 domain-containing protein [Jiangellaceae bacterium]|nr:DUF3618 domain-containing protein [Jiangellaceae bacterium]
MVTTNRTGPVTEPVLPSSRQPVPGSEQYERPAPVPRETAGQRDESSRATPRTAAEIEADMEVTTERLAASINELVGRLRPAQVARRRLASAKSLVTDANGRPRAEVVGALVGALVGAAVLLWRSRRR